MLIEQLYTGCLSHSAYYLESNGEAAIFDPLREVQPYINKARSRHARIKYVFLTHFHADFVSGHLDLAQKTGAQIVLGPYAQPHYKFTPAKDNQDFHVGGCIVKAIHTPGHTMESTTYLLKDETGKEHGIITGDTLFIGDVGRPDLAQHVVSTLTEDKLSRLLYHSLRDKIMPLNDDLVIYPNHGAGSACGKNMSTEKTDTLGHQKAVNYALQPMTEDEFVKVVLDGLTTPPAYFPKNVLMNIQGYESLDSVMERGDRALMPEVFDMIARQENVIVLDTRDAGDFARGFVPNSINIGLNGNFAPWVGELIPDIKGEILLICDKGKEKEAITRLSRVGYDGAIGYLQGGFESWRKAGYKIDRIERITAAAFETYCKKNPLVIDLRKKSEYDSQHVVGSLNVPLNEIDRHLSVFPKDKPFILLCGAGYRSMIGASVLRRRGWDNFVDVIGGFDAIRKTSVPVSNFVSPASML